MREMPVLSPNWENPHTPERLSPYTAATEAAPQSPGSATRDATTMQGLCAAAGEEPAGAAAEAQHGRQ